MPSAPGTASSGSPSALLAVAAVPAMPLAGRLSDRHGAGEALQLTLLGFALVLPLAGLAGSVVALLPALVLLGVATGALDVVANTAAAAWERAEAGSGRQLMSLAHGAFSFGVLGGSVGAGLCRQAGVPTVAVLLVVGGAVAAVAGQVPTARPAAQQDPAGGARSMTRPLLLVGLLVAGSFLVEDGLQSWSALQLERGLDAGPAVSGLGPGVFAGAMGVGRLGGHVLGSRTTPARLVVAGGGLTAAGVALLVVAGSAPVALVGLAVAGAGASVLAPVLYTAVGERAAPGRQGADLALVSALGYAGFVAGPPLVGAVSAGTSLPVALSVLGAIGFLLACAGPAVLSERGGVRPGRAVSAAGSR